MPEPAGGTTVCPGADGLSGSVGGTGVERLRSMSAFASVDDAALASFVAAARIRQLDAGATLLYHGEVSDDVHVVLAGRLTVHLPDGDDPRSVIGLVEPGDVVGEIAALTGGPRTATVIADGPVTVATIPVADFTAVIEAAPELSQRLTELAHQRLRQGQLVDHLHRLLPSLSADGIAELAAVVEWATVPAGATLFREGDPADAAYVVLSGNFRAERHRPDGGTDLVGEIARGELLGEQALLEGGQRTASVIAAQDADLARLPQAAFETVMQRHPQVMLAVARTAIARARRPAPVPAGIETVLTLVAAHDTVDLDAVAGSLLTTMAGHRRIVRLTRDRVAATWGRDDLADADDASPGGLRLVRWLEELEGQHEMVVLQADRTTTPWTRRAVRRAEHLIVVADATADPTPSDLEQWLDEPGVVPHRPRRSLVLLHPADVEFPSGTAAWLDPRQVDQHHHVRAGHDRDLPRVARHLAGAAVGLALSGGGARGYGHLGAVQALRETEVPIDLVGGTSMGCAIGAVLALDHPTQEDFVAAVAEAFRDPLDFTLPVAGLITGKAIAAAAERLGPGRDVEDLPIPFFGMTTDLTNSRATAHRRGSLRRLVRASVAIPGVIPPVVIDEALHVDGGVLDNLPTQAVRDRVRTGTVLAIDAAPPSGPSAPEDFGTHVSGWRQVFDKLVPGRRPIKVPGMATTVMRSLLAAATREREQVLEDGVADLYLHLGRLPCGLLEFDAIDRVVEASYEVAKEPVTVFAASHPQVTGA
jgi:lysophospholipid hydrolase